MTVRSYYEQFQLGSRYMIGKNEFYFLQQALFSTKTQHKKKSRLLKQFEKMSMKTRGSHKMQPPPSLQFMSSQSLLGKDWSKRESAMEGQSLDYFKKLEGELLEKSDRYSSLIGKNKNSLLHNKRKMTEKANSSIQQLHQNLSRSPIQEGRNDSPLQNQTKLRETTISYNKYNQPDCDSHQRNTKKQESLSLEDLHRNFKKNYQTYLNKKAQPESMEDSSNTSKYHYNNPKPSIKALFQKTQKGREPEKQIKSKQKTATKQQQLQRRIVYHLALDDSNPSTLEDSPQCMKVVHFPDEEKIWDINPYISKNATSKNQNYQKSQKLEGCLKTRRNSKFDSLGQTVSTKFSYNAKFSDRNCPKIIKTSTLMKETIENKSLNKTKGEKATLKTEANDDFEEKYMHMKERNGSKDFQSDKVSRSPKYQLKEKTQMRCEYLDLNEFKVLEELGQGKVGTVYIARHKKTNFHCALKVIPKGIVGEHLLVQLVREIKVQMFLDHPNIVQLFSFFEDRENIFLVLQLCYSGNLYTYLKSENCIPQLKIRSIIKQVCHAIEYMHDNDILHRDIKPQNILIHENIIKICDFGWAVHSPEMRDTLCGTPIYASPEIVQKKCYTNKIDVWNIGILAYELLFGRVPFEIRSESDLYRVVTEEIHFPRSIKISSDCEDFVKKCLKKNPQHRFNIVQLLEHPFLQNTD